MTVRYFTREEANEVLAELKPLMAQLLERRAKTVRISRQLESSARTSPILTLVDLSQPPWRKIS